MNKFKNFLIVVLLAAVVLLGTGVFLLSQRDRTASESDADQSALTQAGTDAGEEGALEEETAAELDCSVQLGALKIIRGEEFGILEGDAGDCEAYLEDGVYTISVSTTREAPVVVTVPEEVQFERATLTASGGNLTAEDLEAEKLYTTCERGALQFSVCVDKTAEVEHLQGETVLQLSGDPSEFNYELSYELGHIEVGDQSYAGAKGSRFIDHGSDKTIRVHCAMGSVGVLFPEES